MGILVAGCAGNSAQDAGDRLVRELRATYADSITAIEFENNPPIDPPTMFIDLVSSMQPEEQRRFLCDEIKPKVDNTGHDINVVVAYGWTTHDDCESAVSGAE